MMAVAEVKPLAIIEHGNQRELQIFETFGDPVDREFVQLNFEVDALRRMAAFLISGRAFVDCAGCGALRCFDQDSSPLDRR